jgi:hypothetical protein
MDGNDVVTRTLSAVPDASLEPVEQFSAKVDDQEIALGAAQPGPEAMVEFIQSEPYINLLGIPLGIDAAQQLYVQLGDALELAIV